MLFGDVRQNRLEIETVAGYLFFIEVIHEKVRRNYIAAFSVIRFDERTINTYS